MISHPNRNQHANNKGTRVALKRWFGDLEVVEASRDLHVQPKEEDAINGIRKDPSQCMFSKACQRMYDSTVVLFFGTVAYVDLLDEDGIRRVNRFMIDSPAQAVINAYDKGKKVNGAGFKLRAPRETETVDNKNQRNKERRESILKGERPRLLSGRKEKSQSSPNPWPARMDFFRNGSGRVHFSEK